MQSRQTESRSSQRSCTPEAWSSIPPEEERAEVWFRRIATGLPDLGPVDGGAAGGDGGRGVAPSHVARRENKRAADLEASAPSLPSAPIVRNKRISNQSTSSLPEADMHAEVWKEAVSTVEGMLSGFRGRDEPEAAMAVARMSLKKDVRRSEVRAERTSRVSINPRMQVAQRVEMKRQAEFEVEGPVDTNVPMHKVVIPGMREKFELVDIHAVRLKCRQLQPGISVKLLLEQQVLEERLSNLSVSQSMPSISCAGSFTDGDGTPMPSFNMSTWTSATDASSFSLRRQRAQARKQAGRLDKMLRRLHNMRGNPSEEEMVRLHHLAQEVVDSGERDVEERVSALVQESPQRRAFLETCALHQDLPIPGLIAASQDFVQQTRSLHATTDLGEPKYKTWTRAASPRRAAVGRPGTPSGRRQMNLAALEGIKKVRAQKRLQAMRGVVRTLQVYFAHKRRSEAVLPVRAVLKDLTEFTKMRQAVKRLISAVKLLTRAIRAFVNRRRQRIDEWHETWKQVEDYHLSNFFERFAKAAAEESEMKRKATKEVLRAGRGKSQPAPMDYKNLFRVKNGWQKLRIPVEERSSILTSYYSMLLRAHAKRMKDWYSVVDSAVAQARWDREVSGFLQDPSTRRRRKVDRAALGLIDPGVEEKFWHLTEDMVLDMIAFVVSGLKQVAPFSEHPSSGFFSIECAMAKRDPNKGASLIGQQSSIPRLPTADKADPDDPMVVRRRLRRPTGGLRRKNTRNFDSLDSEVVSFSFPHRGSKRSLQSMKSRESLDHPALPSPASRSQPTLTGFARG